MMRLAFAIWVFGCAAQADQAALRMINAERTDQQRSALVWNGQLERAAQAHAQDMAAQSYFSHTGADGSSVRDRVTRTGYRGCFWAENIAQGQRDLASVMGAWMGSRGHRKNILHRKAREVGLARAAGNTWVMVLAAPC